MVLEKPYPRDIGKTLEILILITIIYKPFAFIAMVTVLSLTVFFRVRSGLRGNCKFFNFDIDYDLRIRFANAALQRCSVEKGRRTNGGSLERRGQGGSQPPPPKHQD